MRTIILFLLALTTTLSTELIAQNHSINQAFAPIGNANWKVEQDSATASNGIGYLVSKKSYKNFKLSIEFKAATNSNGGIFFRCQDSKKIDDQSCYEANIYDLVPGQNNRTGAITHIAPPQHHINTENQLNTYEIEAIDDHLIIKLNGITTVDIRDNSKQINFRQYCTSV